MKTVARDRSSSLSIPFNSSSAFWKSRSIVARVVEKYKRRISPRRSTIGRNFMTWLREAAPGAVPPQRCPQVLERSRVQHVGRRRPRAACDGDAPRQRREARVECASLAMTSFTPRSRA